MRLEKKKNYKVESITIRCTKNQKDFLYKRAALYCDGNLSEYILYCGLNFVIGKEDLIEEDAEAPSKKY